MRRFNIQYLFLFFICLMLSSGEARPKRYNELLNLAGLKDKCTNETLFRYINYSPANKSLQVVSMVQFKESYTLLWRSYETEKEGLSQTYFSNQTLSDGESSYLFRIIKHLISIGEVRSVNNNDGYGNEYLEINYANHDIIINYSRDPVNLYSGYRLFSAYLLFFRGCDMSKDELRAEYWPYAAYYKDYSSISNKYSGKEIEENNLINGINNINDVVLKFGYPNEVLSSSIYSYWAYYLKKRGMLVIVFDRNYNVLKDKIKAVYTDDLFLKNFPLKGGGTFSVTPTANSNEAKGEKGVEKGVGPHILSF